MMGEARRSENWDHTAQMLCLTANIHRDPNKREREFVPADFHPFASDEDRSGRATKEQNRHKVTDWAVVRKAWGL